MRSFSADELPGESALMRLFAIGSHLTELIVDLKEGPYVGQSLRDCHATEVSPEARSLIDHLSRDFGNLREVAQARDVATAESLLEGFCETLDSVAGFRPDLESKCTDLSARLTPFVAPVGDPDDGPEYDLPF